MSVDNFRWTDARLKTVAQQLAAESRGAAKARKGDPILSPYRRANQACFYGKKDIIGKMPDGTPIVASNLPHHGTARGGPKIRSTQLEPGVAVECDSYTQFEAECRRRGKQPG